MKRIFLKLKNNILKNYDFLKKSNFLRFLKKYDFLTFFSFLIFLKFFGVFFGFFFGGGFYCVLGILFKVTKGTTTA